MGWNSWYIHYNRVSDKHLREAADQMIASGMADYGYQYVNCDDCWARHVKSTRPQISGPPRDAQGRMLPNQRFPDMQALTGYIHAKGLKAGIYISPGPATCGGYEGSYGHEALDARTLADWGFDFLKYDWCSYGQVAGGKTLRSTENRISRCGTNCKSWTAISSSTFANTGATKFGNGAARWAIAGGPPATWGWRAAGCPAFVSVGLINASHWLYARPGAWNDPDYILIGWVGDAAGMGEGRPTTLTPDEQYAYMSMWCLMAAPLIYSGDMARLDPFTLNVLCNPEVIDLDQDPLGKQARIVRSTDRELILAKELEDGALAVGLFNFDEKPARLSVSWSDLGLSGKRIARDPWRQVDLGPADGAVESLVPRHGVALVRLRKAE